MKSEKGERIKPKTYQDYNQWDTFVHKDLDKMLHDFDEEVLAMRKANVEGRLKPTL